MAIVTRSCLLAVLMALLPAASAWANSAAPCIPARSLCWPQPDALLLVKGRVVKADPNGFDDVLEWTVQRVFAGHTGAIGAPSVGVTLTDDIDGQGNLVAWWSDGRKQLRIASYIEKKTDGDGTYGIQPFVAFNRYYDGELPADEAIQALLMPVYQCEQRMDAISDHTCVSGNSGCGSGPRPIDGAAWLLLLGSLVAVVRLRRSSLSTDRPGAT